jgi:gamma-glutamylcyclotransferase (GGCT)/AIG2-like uncharacterized protein YtfP
MSGVVLFFAYGMLTHPDYMDGSEGEAAVLLNHKFELLQFANVIECAHNKVDGVLWVIPISMIEHLDRIEGCPHMYVRKVGNVVTKVGKTVDAFYHTMTPETRSELERTIPSSYYKNIVTQGYIMNSVPTQQLIDK